jgi:hypothetical protein
LCPANIFVIALPVFDPKELPMGKKDNRRTRKMLRLKAQKKKKAVQKRRITEAKAAAAKTATPSKTKKK